MKMTAAEAHKITTDLIAVHGLRGWKFGLDNAKTRSGVCNYSTRTIGISRVMLGIRSYDDMLNTITHEIAHALVGHAAGHNRVWAMKHRELGGDGKRCGDITSEQRNELVAVAAWVGTCSHGQQFPRHRQPKRMDGWRCRCAGGTSVITWARQR